MKFGRMLAGLVGGLGLGMLFAPKKGKDLRNRILKKTKSDDPTDGLKELGMAFKEAGEEILTEMKKLSEHEKVGAALDASKSKLKEQMERLEEKYPDFAKLAKEKIDAITLAAEENKGKIKNAVKKAKATKKQVDKKVKAASKKVKSVKKDVDKKVSAAKKKADKVVEAVKETVSNK